jgi:hypothetical protein
MVEPNTNEPPAKGRLNRGSAGRAGFLPAFAETQNHESRCFGSAALLCISSIVRRNAREPGAGSSALSSAKRAVDDDFVQGALEQGGLLIIELGDE